MINWKYFRLILVLPLFLFTERVQVYSKTVVQETNNYNERSIEENLETKVQELYQKAIQQFQNGNLETALETFQQLLDIRMQQGNSLNISSTLYSMATIYKQLHKYQLALEYYQQALEIRQQLGNKNRIAATLHNIGTVYYYLSQYSKALASLNKALEIRRQLGDNAAISRTLNEIAVVYDNQSKYLKALEFYQDALEIAKTEKDSANIRAILSNMGLVYSQLGQYEKAIDFYQQVLETNPSTKGMIFNNIGAVYRRLKKFTKALKFYLKALKINQENPDSLAIATTLDNIGVIYREKGQYSLALESHKQALDIREKLGDRQGLAATFHNIGIVYRESGQYPEALQFLTHGLIIDKQLGNRDGQRVTLGNIGKLLAKKQPELAIIFYKQSVNLTEDIRHNLKVLSVEQQEYFAESVAEIYRSLADLLLQEKRVIEAYKILDLLKVQEIFEYIGSVESDKYKSTEVPLLEMEKKFWQKYSQFIDTVSQNRHENPDILSAKLVDVRDLINSPEVANIVWKLKKNASSQKLNVEILASLQSELKKYEQENTVVLYPLLLEDRIELILVTSNSLPLHHTVFVKPEEFDIAVSDLRKELTNKTKAESNNTSNDKVMEAGLKLYNWLIKPIESHLKTSGAKTIIYAPDGKLRYIPLAGLYDGEKWLAERFKINNITAASLIKFIPREEVNPQILAGALTEGNYQLTVAERSFYFERLPFARVEVEKLAEIFPETKKLLGNAFTKEAMESNMGSYNIVHFATHSAFVRGHPEESFILFGDGELTNLQEVEDWNLKGVELVVLSGCQTGLGKELGNGAEILGFGYQMQLAGAKASLATLWRVHDQGTSEFMTYFYVALKDGVSKIEAVQKAQIAMINSEFNHPYYWAPFILIGNGF